jgi:hypothetical protein
MPSAINGRQILKALPLIPVLNNLQNRADFLRGKSPLVTKQVTKLLKNPVRLAHAEFIPFDMQLVSASDQANAQSISDGSQVLIAAAKKKQGFVSVIQGYGHFAHRANQQ